MTRKTDREICEAALEAEKFVADGPMTKSFGRHFDPVRVAVMLDVIEAARELNGLRKPSSDSSVGLSFAKIAVAANNLDSALARLDGLDQEDSDEA